MSEDVQTTDVVRHEPLEVTSVDDIPMVKCSCDGDDPRHVRWSSWYWLQQHWQGTQDAGVAAICAVIDRQRAEDNTPGPTEEADRG